MARPSHTAFSTLTGTDEIVTAWNRGERGSADRIQMRHYAISVAVEMGMLQIGDELQCIHCGLMFHVPSLGDVDRTNDQRGYVPGNVIMTCRACNETRGHMQQAGTDLAGSKRYIADVLAASARVHVPSKNDAMQARSPWRGTPRQRIGGIHWVNALSHSPYFH